MYEYNEDDKKVDFSHNPFSMPQGGLEALQTQDPLTIKAFQYDITCNGYEIASGGIRNHAPEAMVKAFEIAGYGEKDVVERFGGMYRAFQYGAPPHGGMAAGVDRIVMLLCGTKNLREISLFPMNQQAEDLLMGAPSEATHQAAARAAHPAQSAGEGRSFSSRRRRLDPELRQRAPGRSAAAAMSCIAGTLPRGVSLMRQRLPRRLDEAGDRVHGRVRIGIGGRDFRAAGPDALDDGLPRGVAADILRARQIAPRRDRRRRCRAARARACRPRSAPPWPMACCGSVENSSRGTLASATRG